MNRHLLPPPRSVCLALVLLPGCVFAFAPKHSVSGPPPERRIPSPEALWLPDGYRASVAVGGLTFPVGVAVDEAGAVWVVESGYSYGEVFTEPRLLKILPDATWEIVATGEDAPWTGVDAAEGALFVVEGGSVEGGSVLRMTPDGEVTTLVTNLPGLGDHHTDGPAVHEGMVYFGQGTATNSAVVGLDNHAYGWLARRPTHHDVPCADVRLNEATWKTPDPLTEDPGDMAVTGAFAPFGEVRGPSIPGELPCTGAVMRVPTKGGPLELVAWGFRNPFGLAFSGEGRLWVTDNGYDARGSRPVQGAGDWLWEVPVGGEGPAPWFGWPDFAGGKPVDTRRFAEPFKKPPEPILAEPPGVPPAPAAIFGVHASANGIAFASDAFGFDGQAFVAEFGDMAPSVGKVLAAVGRRVVRVETGTGVIRPFLSTLPDAPPGSGLERPVDVAFSPDGRALYVVDFGVMTMDGKTPKPVAGTGAVWRIERTGAAQ